MNKIEVEYLGTNNLPVIVIFKNFYTKEEQDKIWQELDFLTYGGKLLSGDKTGSAINDHGHIKNNHAIFLDDVYGYKYRFVSNILTILRKTFTPKLLDTLVDFNPLFRNIKMCNHDATLLSYYQHGDSYFSHTDLCNYTILNYFYKEPKQFTGGELYLNDFCKSIEIENNMVIFMPSSYRHEVKEVRMDDKTPFSGKGRYCLSQFVRIVDNKV